MTVAINTETNTTICSEFEKFKELVNDKFLDIFETTTAVNAYYFVTPLRFNYNEVNYITVDIHRGEYSSELYESIYLNMTILNNAGFIDVENRYLRFCFQNVSENEVKEFLELIWGNRCDLKCFDKKYKERQEKIDKIKNGLSATVHFFKNVFKYLFIIAAILVCTPIALVILAIVIIVGTAKLLLPIAGLLALCKYLFY